MVVGRVLCICVLCVIIVCCTFYSVCSTDASDVCATKITYLLTTNCFEENCEANEIVYNFLIIFVVKIIP